MLIRRKAMLIVTGTIAYDYIMDFPGKFADHIHPDKIHQINLSFIVDTFEKRRGGTAGNISYNLGLLEHEHILFSCAGKDFSEYKEYFEKMGISTKEVVIDENQHSSSGFGMTDKNNNQIWGYFYGAGKNIINLDLKTVANKNDFILIGPSGAVATIKLLKQAVELDIPYMFDPGFILTEVDDQSLELGIKHAEIIIGNDYEIDLIKRRIKNFSSIVNGKTVITTLGKEGAVIENNGSNIKIAVALPKKVADPTGAGDAWRAGFLAGYARKFDLETCGRMGSVAASFSVEEYGAQEHKFTKEQFIERYRQTYGDLIKL